MRASSRRLRWGAAALVAALAWGPPALGEVGSIALLDEVTRHVEEHFFSPQRLQAADWKAAVAAARARLDGSASAEEVTATIDRLLATLGASHTARYTPADAAYHHLVALFRASLEEEHPELYREAPGYVDIGVLTVEQDGRHFVHTVLAGTPAAITGLEVGDELVAVDGAPWSGIAAWAGREGESVRLAVRRSSGAAPLGLEIVPRHFDATTMFLDAQRQGAQLVEIDGVAVGYVPLPSYAGQQVQDLLIELTQEGPLAAAAALVLDLRGGWGGADPAYLSYFDPRVPRLTYIDREGGRLEIDRAWTRPVVLLVDEATRSGKEVLAHAFRRHGIGPVVGGTTAGAVLGGRPFPLSDGSLLYLAVMDVRVDGERLEGRGVVPDVLVPFTLPFAGGADPRRERALRVAAALAPGAPPLLNSERIAATFGSYGVEVLASGEGLRVSSLYSEHDGRRIGRTFAVTLYPAVLDARLAEAHREIRAGGSIGATLTAHGWRVDKHPLHLGLLGENPELEAVYRLMAIPPTPLAVHVYRLVATRGAAELDYATIVEIHHPDYLDLEAAREIYRAADPAVGRRSPAVEEILRAVLSAASGLSVPTPAGR